MTVSETIEEAKKVGVKDMSWKAWFMIITIISAATVASYYGVNVTMNLDLANRVGSLEGMLSHTINSTFYTLQKQASYIVSTVTSGATTYYCMQNGTSGKLDFWSTNLTLVEQFANGNLTSAGGLIWLKEAQHNTSLTLGYKVLEIESYNGTLRSWSNEGKGFLLSTLASDPNTAGWGTAEAPYWWYNSAEDTIKYWNGTGIVIIPSIGGGSSSSYTLPYTYTVYKSGSNYVMEKYDGTTWSSTLANRTWDYAIANTSALGGGTVFGRAATYDIPSHINLLSKVILKGEGPSATILRQTGNDCVITMHEKDGINAWQYQSGIEDLQILCQGGTYPNTNAVEATQIRLCLFKNVEVRDCDLNDWYITGSANRPSSVNTWDHVRSYGHHITSGAQFYVDSYAIDSLITDCFMEYKQYGFYQASATTTQTWTLYHYWPVNGDNGIRLKYGYCYIYDLRTDSDVDHQVYVDASANNVKGIHITGWHPMMPVVNHSLFYCNIGNTFSVEQVSIRDLQNSATNPDYLAQCAITGSGHIAYWLIDGIFSCNGTLGRWDATVTAGATITNDFVT